MFFYFVLTACYHTTGMDCKSQNVINDKGSDKWECFGPLTCSVLQITWGSVVYCCTYRAFFIYLCGDVDGVWNIISYNNGASTLLSCCCLALSVIRIVHLWLTPTQCMKSYAFLDYTTIYSVHVLMSLLPDPSYFQLKSSILAIWSAEYVYLDPF